MVEEIQEPSSLNKLAIFQSFVVLVSSLLLIIFTLLIVTLTAENRKLKSEIQDKPRNANQVVNQKKCYASGCSKEICQSEDDPPKASICIYKDEYGCLSFSVCEVQNNGECGWAQTPKYLDCLKNLQQ